MAQRITFKRPRDGVRARVVPVGFNRYEVDVWDRDGYRFTDEEGDCEPRCAAAQALAMYDELRGVRVAGPAGVLDFELVEQPVGGLSGGNSHAI